VIKAFQSKGWKTTGTGLTRASPPDIVKLDLLSHDGLVSVLEQTKLVKRTKHCLVTNYIVDQML
jgi:hypothetical protein